MLLNLGSCNRLLAEENDGGAFEYRDVYLPDYSKEESKKLRLDHLDDAWGIWGHNLSSVLPDQPSKQVYVKVGGGVNDDQFCFSSNQLYDYIKEFIQDRYLLTDSVRFAILPNDNQIVCLCTECVKAGNTKGDASPAVLKMITRLSKKFPQHKFFTSHYATTANPPKDKLPDNAGVIISAMDYPLSAVETSGEKTFFSLIDNWKKHTERIYIWDYVNNFDDYFTPFPVFSVMQHRLKKYRDAGVTGVFLNGSGTDYSTFGKLKRSVLSEMLYDPDADWKELVRKYAKEYYPTAGSDITDFILLQEKFATDKGSTLPMYEGVNKAVDLYLPEKEFVDFYNKLVMHKKNASGEELEELELMTDAMAYTMLELKRINDDFENTAKLQERLGRLPGKDIPFYNEGCWSLTQYLNEYKAMDEEAQATASTNKLKGKSLVPVTKLDEDYTDVSILTDGLLGTPSNYHNGLLITSADPMFKIKIPRQPGMSKIKVWMVHNPGFKIGLPEEVFVTVDDVDRKSQIPAVPKGASGHSWLEFDVPGNGEIILNLKKGADVKTMAIDEIQGF